MHRVSEGRGREETDERTHGRTDNIWGKDIKVNIRKERKMEREKKGEGEDVNREVKGVTEREKQQIKVNTGSVRKKMHTACTSFFPIGLLTLPDKSSHTA